MANQKPRKRRALGRGLSNLIPVEPEEPDVSREGSQYGGNGVISYVPRDQVRTNPYQPRVDFDDEEIRGLADSIQNQGLLQPVVLRKCTDGYEIISGERRFRAMGLLEYDKVPCLVKEEITDREMLEMALVENIQREDLNEIEKAHAYSKLMADCGLSHEELSKRVGKSRSAVTNSLRLLKLSSDLQQKVRTGELTMGHARSLLSIDGEDFRNRMAERIVKENLSVRDVEREMQKQKPARTKKKPDSAHSDPNLNDVVEKLRYKFGTAVKISGKPDGKGAVEISFYGTEDLNRILDMIIG